MEKSTIIEPYRNELSGEIPIQDFFDEELEDWLVHEIKGAPQEEQNSGKFETLSFMTFDYMFDKKIMRHVRGFKFKAGTKKPIELRLDTRPPVRFLGYREGNKFLLVCGHKGSLSKNKNNMKNLVNKYLNLIS